MLILIVLGRAWTVARILRLGWSKENTFDQIDYERKFEYQ